MRARVLISAPYMVPVVGRFRAELEAAGVDVVVAEVEERLSEEQLLRYVGDIDGIICGDDRLTAHVLTRAPRLKVISKWGTGIDSIDRAVAEKLGIAVCNTPGAFSVPVADTTLGYMLCFARGLVRMTLRMRAGEWHKIPGFALHEKTLGIIGVGSVGRAVGRLARAFGMRILGADPVAPPPDFVLHTGIEIVDLDMLLRESDFVSVHCDLNQTSYHLLDDRTFGVVKPGAIIINTARGPVVDEAALVRVLQSGRAGGAALDVFEVEPLPADSPLRAMENVLLAPHNANSSPSAWERVHRNTIDNLLRELRSGAARR